MSEKYNVVNVQLSIVFLGKFNPLLFHPEWFVKYGIMKDEEAKIALANNGQEGKNAIVSSNVTYFQTEDFEFTVDQNKMQILSLKGVETTALDFAVSTMKHLGSTTINACGFNYISNTRINTKEDYQLIGDTLAPKDCWSDMLGEDVSGNERKSGLTCIKMTKRKDNNEGAINFVLEPSATVEQGVYIQINDHCFFGKEGNDSQSVSEFVLKNFSERIKYLSSLKEKVLGRVFGETL